MENPDAPANERWDSTLQAQDDAAAAVAVAPRVTLEHLESLVEEEEYAFFFGKVTICVLRATNGFTFVGESACVDPANFNEALGKTIARRQAMDKMWGAEGYLLQERLYVAARSA